MFLKDDNYKRYIVGKFDDCCISDILKEYSEICIDTPKINNDYYNINEWTIIDFSKDLISKGLLFDLMNYMSQYSKNIFVIGINENNSYFVINDKSNSFGDTVIVKFDDGTTLQWDLPQGLVYDKAYTVIGNVINENNCIEFLKSIKADDLINHFNL